VVWLSDLACLVTMGGRWARWGSGAYMRWLLLAGAAGAVALIGCSAASPSDQRACAQAGSAARPFAKTVKALSDRTMTYHEAAPSIGDAGEAFRSAAGSARTVRLRRTLESAARDLARIRVDYLQDDDATTDWNSFMTSWDALGVACPNSGS